MESQSYKSLLTKAMNNELTGEDLSAVFLALDSQKVEQDREIKTVKEKIAQNKRKLQDIDEEYPLLPPEADDLANAVKKKGVEVLGGKKSNAYNDKDLRKRVYMDIYGEMKRQFGLINERGGQMSYKKLKRKYLKSAFEEVDNYILPSFLESEIDTLNDIDMSD